MIKMNDMLSMLNEWGIPTILLIICTLVFLLSQTIGEVIELCGKSAPTFLKIRKWFQKRRDLKRQRDEQYAENTKTLKEIKDQQARVEQLLIESAKRNEENERIISEFNQHYCPENIAKRDKWMLDVNHKMKWVDERAKVYDESVKDLIELAEVVKKQSEIIEKQNDALEINNKMTSELYKQGTRTQILDFSHRLVNARKADKPVIFSREEFRKIRKSYAAYEEFLSTFGGTNGEVDDAMAVVRDAEAGKLPNIEFLEDLRD